MTFLIDAKIKVDAKEKTKAIFDSIHTDNKFYPENPTKTKISFDKEITIMIHPGIGDRLVHDGPGRRNQRYDPGVFQLFFGGAGRREQIRDQKRDERRDNVSINGHAILRVGRRPILRKNTPPWPSTGPCIAH